MARPAHDGEKGAPASVPQPRWLDADQQRHWRSFLQGTSLLFERLDRVLEESFGLSLGDYELMVRLSESPDHALRMSQLAAELVHSRSRVTYAVSTMERRGLVARCAAERDRRGVTCRLTEAGWELLQEAAQAHVASVRDYFVDVITPAQLAAIGDAMEMVTAATRAPHGADGRD